MPTDDDDTGPIVPPLPKNFQRITEAGDNRITEDGDNRITEDNFTTG
jgi:hypothetical protein